MLSTGFNPLIVVEGVEGLIAVAGLSGVAWAGEWTAQLGGEVVAMLVATEIGAVVSAATGGEIAASEVGTNDAYVAMGIADAALIYGSMILPVVGPVIAALEYFDVIDWF